MAILNFKEIPRANIASGEQDMFELFARDYLESMGYDIVEGPDRGADGGRDLIAEEIRRGINNNTIVRWLVSCKHKAHSGQSVTLKDEVDILDRVRSNTCNGFIGFYSTLPSTGLTKKLKGFENDLETLILDSAKIEKTLLRSGEGMKVAARYFPESLASWKIENPEPANIYPKNIGLYCASCGIDLLKSHNGIVVLLEDYTVHEIIHVYWCCKGICDQKLQRKHNRENLIDLWDDIEDLRIPMGFMRWLINFIDERRCYAIYN